jgi:hypothetical protein
MQSMGLSIGYLVETPYLHARCFPLLLRNDHNMERTESNHLSLYYPTDRIARAMLMLHKERNEMI